MQRDIFDEVHGTLQGRSPTAADLPDLPLTRVVFEEAIRLFDPTRFLPGRAAAAGRPKFAYFPFGGDPCQCIGNHFALMEATLILATITQRFRVELVLGQEIVPDTTFTLRPKLGVEVALWPR